MITKKDIMDYLVFYFTMIHGYKTGHSKVMAKDITKALMKKIKEKKFNTYIVDSKFKDIGNGVKERTITIKKRN